MIENTKSLYAMSMFTWSKVRITLPKFLQLSWLEAIFLLCGNNEFNSTSMAMVVSEGINYCNFLRHSLNIRCLSFLKYRKVLESDIWARKTVFLSTINIFDLKLVNVENPFNSARTIRLMGKQKVETNGNYGKPSKEWTPPLGVGGGCLAESFPISEFWAKPFPIRDS